MKVCLNHFISSTCWSCDFLFMVSDSEDFSSQAFFCKINFKIIFKLFKQMKNLAIFLKLSFEADREKKKVNLICFKYSLILLKE